VSDVTIDPFELVRRELRSATIRDVRRRERRQHVLRTTAVAFGAIVLLTGIAAAANDRVASSVARLTAPISDVFTGPPATEAPSDRATHDQQFMEDLARGINPEARGDAPRIQDNGKVLLHDTMDGHEVEIVAVQRPLGSPSALGPIKRAETCFTIVVEPANGTGGTTCSPEFMPEAAANYGVMYGTGPGGVIQQMSISGLVGSGIVDVNIVTKEDVQKALVGDHAFYWYSEDSIATAVELVFADGTRKRMTRLLDDRDLRPANAPPLRDP
jgi:hypothetical protein